MNKVDYAHIKQIVMLTFTTVPRRQLREGERENSQPHCVLTTSATTAMKLILLPSKSIQRERFQGRIVAHRLQIAGNRFTFFINL